MYYKYSAIELLNSYETEHFEKVHICCYYIYSNGINPILSYLLINDAMDDEKNNYQFPVLKNDVHIQENVIDYFTLTLKQTICFKGFKKFNKQLFAFYELNEINKTPESISVNNNCIYERCLIYEILNTQKIKKYNISNTVVDFFLNNSSFCYLYNTKNELIEIPITAFQIISQSKLKYICYNEIILEPNDDYFKLNLVYENKTNHETLRYAVFLQEFYSFNNLNKINLNVQFKLCNSIIISKDKQIYFKDKMQQLLL